MYLAVYVKSLFPTPTGRRRVLCMSVYIFVHFDLHRGLVANACASRAAGLEFDFRPRQVVQVWIFLYMCLRNLHDTGGNPSVEL